MKQSPWVMLIYVTAGVLVTSALAFKIFQPVQVLPRIRLGPGFALVDQDSQMLSNETLRGSLVLYSFTTTRCDSPTCQSITATMQDVQQQVASIDTGGVPIRMVTISLDPTHDTPDVLAEYAEAVGADPAVWSFATNDDPAILKNIVGGGFEVYYDPQPDGSVAFDQVFILVDGTGLIRGEYRYQTLANDSERILRHFGVLGEEIRNSGGAASAAYEAAHLFLCYAP